jgi:DNA polymerase V
MTAKKITKLLTAASEGLLCSSESEYPFETFTWGNVGEAIAPQQKNMICSRSFGEPCTTLEHMHEAIAYHTARAAAKLRHKGLKASVLGVFIATNRFKNTDDQYSNSVTVTLPTATNSTQVMIHHAKHCITNIFQDGYKYKKCGVILSELSAAESVHLDLLSKAVDPRDDKLMAAIYSLNARFGTGAIKFASEGLQKPWAMKRDMRSPRFTSRWDELPIVKA